MRPDVEQKRRTSRRRAFLRPISSGRSSDKADGGPSKASQGPSKAGQGEGEGQIPRAAFYSFQGPSGAWQIHRLLHLPQDRGASLHSAGTYSGADVRPRAGLRIIELDAKKHNRIPQFLVNLLYSKKLEIILIGKAWTCDLHSANRRPA